MRAKFIFGDIHFKWPHKKALAWSLEELKAEYESDNNLDIIQAGDLYDFLSFNRFAKTSYYITSPDEVDKSRKMAEDFWAEVNEIAPKANKYQLMGNHDARPLRQIVNASPEHYPAVKKWVIDLMSFEGVKTIYDPREELYLDGIAFYHGHLVGPGKHMMKYHETCVTAHTHKGCTIYHPWGNKIMCELNVGFLGDHRAVPMQYTPRKNWTNTTLGYGWIDHLKNMTFRHYPGKI